jgi:hypothetical protein
MRHNPHEDNPNAVAPVTYFGLHSDVFGVIDIICGINPIIRNVIEENKSPEFCGP